MTLSPSRGPGTRSVANGFTLIELLVVITLIVLLIGLLLPALSGARDTGKATVCASNQRQGFIALSAYAGDNGHYWPPINTPWPVIFTEWLPILMRQNYLSPSHPIAVNTGITGMSGGLFCPELTARRAASPRNMSGTWVASNFGLNWELWNRASNGGGAEKPVKLEYVKRPSNVFLVADRDLEVHLSGDGWIYPGWKVVGVSYAYTHPMHGGRQVINMTYLDGHGGKIRFGDDRLEGWGTGYEEWKGFP